MDIQNKTKEELIKELQEMQQEYNSLKASYEKYIADNKISNETLRESEEKYRLIADYATDVIWVLDTETQTFKYMSPSVERMLGFTSNEMIGKSVSDTVTPSSLEFIATETPIRIEKLLQGENRIYTDSIEVVHKDGHIVFTEINQHFVKNPITGLIDGAGVMRDVTEIKKAENEIREANKQLGELNAMKDKFFSIIAHDLIGPMNSILGFSDILVEHLHQKNLDDTEKYAEIIQISSNRAKDLLLNLMEWSQSKTGRMEFNPEYFELVELIEDTKLLLNGVMEQKAISLSTSVHSSVPVFADKKMISAVLRNLISNSIKYTNPGGKINISLEEKKDKLIVSVSDNGVGISKANCEKLFRIDQTLSTSGTKNEKGTGLGLILCKEFLEKHNGKIWVESELWKGSTFYFTIPHYA